MEASLTGVPQRALELLQSHSLAMLVQQEIERLVTSGELEAGAKLNESTLATRLGVSRGPVREAFRGLQETGLLRVEKNRGVFVRQVSLEEADEIYELRASFDELAGRKLAAGVTPAQLRELQSLARRMGEVAGRGDHDAYHLLNLRFHDALIEFAGNRKMLQTYRRLVNELNLYRRHTLTRRDRLPQSTHEHQAIIDAIAARDAETAGRLLREHALASRRRIHETPETPAGQAQ